MGGLRAKLVGRPKASLMNSNRCSGLSVVASPWPTAARESHPPGHRSVPGGHDSFGGVACGGAVGKQRPLGPGRPTKDPLVEITPSTTNAAYGSFWLRIPGRVPGGWPPCNRRNHEWQPRPIGRHLAEGDASRGGRSGTTPAFVVNSLIFPADGDAGGGTQNFTEVGCCRRQSAIVSGHCGAGPCPPNLLLQPVPGQR